MEEQYIETGANEKEIGALQLFTADFDDICHGRFAKYTFTFTAYLTGNAENYRIYQMDDLLNEQLWSSVINQDGTDVKLIANDGKNLSAHKFILEARSPVFAALFSNNKEVEHVNMNCNDDELKQFLKFIYTGELQGLVCKELMELGLKYKLKTLENLVRGAFQKSNHMITLLDDYLVPFTYEICCFLNRGENG